MDHMPLNLVPEAPVNIASPHAGEVDGASGGSVGRL